MKLIIKKSKFGKGGFAGEDIKAGEKIVTFQGELVDRKEIHKRIVAGEERLDDPLQIDDNEFLDLDDEAYFINHSCDPNTVLSGKADLIAMRNIKIGEEFSFDYSATVGKNIDWEMECRCGSANCRKKIGNISTVPEDQIKKYYEVGGLQDFIRRQLGLR